MLTLAVLYLLAGLIQYAGSPAGTNPFVAVLAWPAVPFLAAVKQVRR